MTAPTLPAPVPPRRIAPQTGAPVWLAADLTPNEWMIPAGAEHAAEIEAALADPAAPLPRLSPVLRDIAERCDHGRGFALLRGLAADSHMAPLLLSRLAEAMGRPLAPPAPPAEVPPPCDILALLCLAPSEVALVSAAAVHNAVLLADRAALAALYQLREPAAPAVFGVHGGVFAAWPHVVTPEADLAARAALEAALAAPELPLTMPLRPGDLLCLNPFLVWPRGLSAALLGIPLAATPSRLADGPYGALTVPPHGVGG